jgi:hypothetical protein
LLLHHLCNLIRQLLVSSCHRFPFSQPRLEIYRSISAHGLLPTSSRYLGVSLAHGDGCRASSLIGDESGLKVLTGAGQWYGGVKQI